MAHSKCSLSVRWIVIINILLIFNVISEILVAKSSEHFPVPTWHPCVDHFFLLKTPLPSASMLQTLSVFLLLLCIAFLVSFVWPTSVCLKYGCSSEFSFRLHTLFYLCTWLSKSIHSCALNYYLYGDAQYSAPHSFTYLTNIYRASSVCQILGLLFWANTDRVLFSWDLAVNGEHKHQTNNHTYRSTTID